LCSKQAVSLFFPDVQMQLTPWRLGGFGDFHKKNSSFRLPYQALAPPPIALESCSMAQTDRPV